MMKYLYLILLLLSVNRIYAQDINIIKDGIKQEYVDSIDKKVRLLINKNEELADKNYLELYPIYIFDNIKDSCIFKHEFKDYSFLKWIKYPANYDVTVEFNANIYVCDTIGKLLGVSKCGTDIHNCFSIDYENFWVSLLRTDKVDYILKIKTTCKSIDNGEVFGLLWGIKGTKIYVIYNKNMYNLNDFIDWGYEYITGQGPKPSAPLPTPVF